jgi:hypothetical protein
MNSPTTWEVVVMIWFIVSLITHLLSGVVLALWLSRRGIKMSSAFSGMPGYVERRYRDWAEKSGHSPKLIVNLRIISTINVVIAAGIAILTISGSH